MMLKKKLSRSIDNKVELESNGGVLDGPCVPKDTSNYFVTPFWKLFYDLEIELNPRLKYIKLPSTITHIYNPVEYASDLHCAYLRRYLNGPKPLVFVGMNPGANGMGQTGIPFGNIGTVLNLMGITGEVNQPDKLHTRRPVNGLQCTREEPSGVRIWSLFYELAGNSLETFSKKCFVHNFCPLAFFDKDGKNITPSEIKGEAKNQIRDCCLQTLDEQLKILQPQIVVAVGDYVFTTLKKSQVKDQVKILKMPHPSPRSLNNHNWKEKGKLFLEKNDLLKYFKQEE